MTFGRGWRGYYYSAIVAPAVLWLAPPAHAEDTRVADIFVTARKREENVQRVPDSVSVLSAAKIEAAGIKNLENAVDLVPNVSFLAVQDIGTVEITIRGIGQVRLGEPPVAINVDGVQLTSADQINQILFDLERIEVLKGPQGALYGRNAIGGAINIVTRQPTDTFAARIKAEYANGDDRNVTASVSGPIIRDRVLFSLNGFYRQFDGLFTNVTLNRKVDFETDRYLRGRLILTPIQDLKIDLRAAYSHVDGGASWYIPLPDGDANDTTIPIQSNALGMDNRRTYDYSARIDLNLKPFTITSISAYSRTDLDFFEDLDYTAAPIFQGTQNRYSHAFTQELRFTSPSDQRFRWTGGAFYLDGTRRIDTVLQIGAAPYIDVPFTRTTDYNTDKAVFAQFNYDILTPLELTVGLRYDGDDVSQFDRLGGAGDRRTRFDAWQPKVSLAYKITPEMMAYATFAQGFRSGGFNPPDGVFPEIYKAENTTSYETGLKSRFVDNRILLNLAGFYTEFTNQQVYVLRLADQGIINSHKSRLYGFEAESQANISPAFHVNASLGLIDSKIEDFDGTGLYDGNKVPLTYAWNYTLSGQYTKEMPWGSLVGYLAYTGKGGLYWHVDNQDRQSQVNLVDVRFTVNIKSFSITAFATNLFDHKYSEEFFAKEFSGLASDVRMPAQPRRVGVDVAVKF